MTRAARSYTLINRGCQRAVRVGAERLERELLDQVKNDAASGEPSAVTMALRCSLCRRG